MSWIQTRPPFAPERRDFRRLRIFGRVIRALGPRVADLLLLLARHVAEDAAFYAGAPVSHGREAAGAMAAPEEDPPPSLCDLRGLGGDYLEKPISEMVMRLVGEVMPTFAGVRALENTNGNFEMAHREIHDSYTSRAANGNPRLDPGRMVQLLLLLLEGGLMIMVRHTASVIDRGTRFVPSEDSIIEVGRLETRLAEFAQLFPLGGPVSADPNRGWFPDPFITLWGLGRGIASFNRLAEDVRKIEGFENPPDCPWKKWPADGEEESWLKAVQMLYHTFLTWRRGGRARNAVVGDRVVTEINQTLLWPTATVGFGILLDVERDGPDLTAEALAGIRRDVGVLDQGGQRGLVEMAPSVFFDAVDQFDNGFIGPNRPTVSAQLTQLSRFDPKKSGLVLKQIEAGVTLVRQLRPAPDQPFACYFTCAQTGELQDGVLVGDSIKYPVQLFASPRGALYPNPVEGGYYLFLALLVMQHRLYPRTFRVYRTDPPAAADPDSVFMGAGWLLGFNSDPRRFDTYTEYMGTRSNLWVDRLAVYAASTDPREMAMERPP